MSDATCTVEDCDKPAFCRAMCRKHYRLEMGHGWKPAICASCGADYQRHYKARTDCCPPCSDRTPRKIAAAQAKRKNWPQSKVHFPSCVTCDRVFLARRAGAMYCGAGCRPKRVWATRPCGDCGGKKGLYDSFCQDCRRARVVASRRKNRQANPNRDRGNHRKRAKRFGVTYEPVDRMKVYERDGWVCGLCREPIDPALAYPDIGSASLDHVIPMSRGGGHTYDNTQASHWICNTLKGAALDAEAADPARGVDISRRT